MEHGDGVRTPKDLVEMANRTLRAFEAEARDLDEMVRWLLLNAARLQDERAAAAGYGGMPPFLPHMLRELMDMARSLRELIDRLTPFTSTGDNTGAVAFDRLRLRE